MPRSLRFAFSASAVAIVVVVPVACGARSSLELDDLDELDGFDPSIDGAADGPRDARLDARDVGVDARERLDGTVDARPDGPIFEGGALDVNPECTSPAYCDPSDRGFVYRCGVRVFQCSSIEQCQEPFVDGGRRDAGPGATCANPCVDTLGENTSNGCEFYAIEPDVPADTLGGACYAVFVVNQWETGEPARIEVERNGVALPIAQFARIPLGTGTNVTYAPYDAAQGLARDQVAVLFLSRDPNAANDTSNGGANPRRLAGCPAGVSPAVASDAALHGTGRGRAFHIKSNVPVVAYQMFPYGGGRARATSATLLLPTNVWDTNYVAVNGYTTSSTLDAPATLAIIAKQDGTAVSVLPTNAIAAGPGVIGTPAGVRVTNVLNRGEYLQFTQDDELTGSAIQTSAPVAVVGGNTLMAIPRGRVRADSAHQMLPPVRALGNEYVAVRYRSRARLPTPEESVPWRLVGVVDGTTLTYEPSRPTGAPTTIAAGQVVEIEAPGPFVVRSQGATHPFYASAHMTGGEPFSGEGDPEFVNLIAPAQYLSRYTFFSDPTYPETNLVVVRVKDTTLNRFPDVTLACRGLLAGWTPVGSAGRYEMTRVDLSTGNFEGQGGCDNGVNRIVASFANAPGVVPRIGLTVWGWGNTRTEPQPPQATPDETNPRFTRWVSYAYPGGANITRLNTVVLPTN